MKEQNYLLKDFINERTVNVEKEFENDIVFAKFINYMKVALLHKKLNFLKHQKYLCKKEQTISYEEWAILSDRDNFAYSFFNSKNNIALDNRISLDIAISKLSEKQREIIILHYYQKKPLNLIAKQLNMNANTVRQLKLRAIIKLKKYMEEK